MSASDTEVDRLLRDRFNALRREVEASAPSFEQVVGRRAAPSPVPMRAALAATLIALLTAGLWLLQQPAETTGGPLPGWPTATESLLLAVAAPPVWTRLPTDALARIPSLSTQEQR